MSLLLFCKRHSRAFRILGVVIGLVLLYLLLKETVLTGEHAKTVDYRYYYPEEPVVEMVKPADYTIINKTDGIKNNVATTTDLPNHLEEPVTTQLENDAVLQPTESLFEHRQRPSATISGKMVSPVKISVSNQHG